MLFAYVLQALLATTLMVATTRLSSDSWLALVLPVAWREQGRLPGGPLALVAALCYQHLQLVPDMWLVKFGPWLLGDRMLDWVLLGLLAISQAEATALLAALGILTSAMYASKMPVLRRLRQIRIPSLLYRLLASVGEPWIGSTRLPQRSSRAEPRRRRTRAQRTAERIARDGLPAGAGPAGTAAGGTAGTPGAGPGAEQGDNGTASNPATVRFLTGLMRRWSRRQPPTPTGAEGAAGAV